MSTERAKSRWCGFAITIAAAACGGLPGAWRPGENWVVASESAHPALAENVLLVDWYLDEERSPTPHELHLRARGEHIAVRRLSDVVPHVTTISDGYVAVRYADLLRAFDLPEDEVPGLGRATPDSGGLSPRFDELLLERGIEPGPRVDESSFGFVIERPLIFWSGGTEPRLVLVRETVGRTGDYRCRVLRELAAEEDARALVIGAR